MFPCKIFFIYLSILDFQSEISRFKKFLFVCFLFLLLHWLLPCVADLQRNYFPFYFQQSLCIRRPVRSFYPPSFFFFGLSGKFLKIHILMNFASNWSVYLNSSSPQLVVFPKGLKIFVKLTWGGECLFYFTLNMKRYSERKGSISYPTLKHPLGLEPSWGHLCVLIES